MKKKITHSEKKFFTHFTIYTQFNHITLFTQFTKFIIFTHLLNLLNLKKITHSEIFFFI